MRIVRPPLICLFAVQLSILACAAGDEPPFTVTFQETKFFAAPADISSQPAIAQDGTVVVGATDKKIYFFKPDGTIRATFQAKSSFHPAPAFMPDGTVVVAADRQIYFLTPDGKEKGSFETKTATHYGFSGPRTTGGVHHSPVVMPDGKTVVVSSWDQRIYFLNDDGTVKAQFRTEPGTSPTEPAILPDKTVVVGADSNVHFLTPEGVLKNTFHAKGNVIITPIVMPDGAVLVDAGYHALHVLKSDGTQTAEFKSKPGVSIGPGLVVLPDGTVVVTSSQKSVYFLTPDLKMKAEVNAKEGTWLRAAPDGTVLATDVHGDAYFMNADGTFKTPLVFSSLCPRGCFVSNDTIMDAHGTWVRFIKVSFKPKT